jgi:hypothetical protein
MKIKHAILAIFTILLISIMTTAHAALIENFNGLSTTPWTLTNSSGSAPSIKAAGFVRLTELSPGNNNSIAFDKESTQTGPAPNGIQMQFDFRMTDDEANGAAGGCCDSAADGFGIGLFYTSVYGTSGSNNPGTFEEWERPWFLDAFVVGFDIFENIDVVTLNFDGTVSAEADLTGTWDLNDNRFQSANIVITPNGVNALVNMTIDGVSIFTDTSISGMDLTNFPNYRLIAGGRTGGAYTETDIDNIRINAVPIPAAIYLLGAGFVGLAGLRRKLKK